MRAKQEQTTLEEYRRLQKPAQRATRAKRATLPSPSAEPRTPNGWQADYDEAGRRGFQFSQNGHTCYAWKPGGPETARFPLLQYASAAGTLRRAVEAALGQEQEEGPQ